MCDKRLIAHNSIVKNVSMFFKISYELFVKYIFNVYIWYMRINIDLDVETVKKLEKQAKKEKRTRKAHIEYILYMEAITKYYS